MRKLQEVREARELLKEAMDWSVFKWLWEKTRVRQTTDRANAALELQERAVKAKWDPECKAVLKKLTAKKTPAVRAAAEQTESIDPQMEQLIAGVVETDRAAHRARMDAEEIFEEAERQLSTSLAREGCKKAIHGWDLHEKAIRKAEAVAEGARKGEQNGPAT